MPVLSRRRAVALTALPLTLALLSLPAAGDEPSPPDTTPAAVAQAADGPVTNGMIATFAFPATADHISNGLDLVVMRPDGTGAQVLVPSAAHRSLCGFDLAWSPDGNRIAWASENELWTVEADGTDRQLVGQGCITHLDWSPDGSTLLVEIGSRAGLLTLSSKAFRWLRSCDRGEVGATFSPDGTRVAGVATADCDDDPTGWGIYGFGTATGALDGVYADTNLRGQVPHLGWGAIPSGAEWHPTQDVVLTELTDSWDGATCHPIGVDAQWSNADLFTVSAVDGSSLARIGDTSGEFDLQERDGSWSPDGQRILFTGTTSACQSSSPVITGPGALMSMDPDGSGVATLWTPPNPLGFVKSDWQPCTVATTTCAPVPPPDGDGDGVPDLTDACPATPGPAENGGCPFGTDPTDPEPTEPVPTDPLPTLPPPTLPLPIVPGGANGPGGPEATTGTGRVVNLVRPRITGKPRVGATLRVTKGRWDPSSGLTVRYRWFADGKAVKKGVGKALTITRGMRGKRLTVRVTVKAPGLAKASVRTRRTARVT